MPAAFVQELVSGTNGAFGTPASTSNININGGSKTLTLGNHVFVWVAIDSTGVSTCADNLGNAYSLEVAEAYPLHSILLGLFSAPVSVGGSLTAMTATHTTTSNRIFAAAEFSGVENLFASGTASTGVSTTPSSISSAGDGLHLWSAAAIKSNDTINSVSLTPPSGFTNVFAAGGVIIAGDGSHPSRTIYAAYLAGSLGVTAQTGTIGDTKDWVSVGSQLAPIAVKPALAGISMDGVTVR